MKEKNKPKPVLLVEIKSLDSREFYKSLFEYAPDPYYITDMEGNFIDGNKAAERITGYQKEELVGKNFFQLNILPAGELPKAQQALTKNQQGFSTGPDEFSLYRKDHKKIEVEIFTYPLKMKDKPLILVIARDITERKKEEHSYRTVFENTGTATVIIEEDKTISLANRQFEKLSGYSKEEIENKMKWSDFVVLEDLEKMERYHQLRRQNGESPPSEYEFHIRDRKGNIKNILLKIDTIPHTKKSVASLLDVTDINQSQQNLRKALNATIEAISKISETLDPYTAGHQYKVYQLSVAIARELTLSREKIEAVRIAALIHDIGKMAIPSEILTKPGKLSEIEFDLIKEHPKTGYEILKDIDFPYPIAQIIRQHHERINGSGYPQGLKGENILLEAKIIGVADVVEAMSSHRPYRAALGVDVALDEITKNKGILYDPKIVDVCVKLFQEKGFKFE